MKLDLEFVTATCNDHRPLLKSELNKRLILEALKYLVESQSIQLFSYVIMDNHFHLLWRQIKPGNQRQRLMSFLSHRLKERLKNDQFDLLEFYKSNKKNKAFEIFEASHVRFIYDINEAKQVCAYIHNNPVKAYLCSRPQDYQYSSSAYFSKGIDQLEILTSLEIYN